MRRFLKGKRSAFSCHCTPVYLCKDDGTDYMHLLVKSKNVTRNEEIAWLTKQFAERNSHTRFVYPPIDKTNPLRLLINPLKQFATGLDFF